MLNGTNFWSNATSHMSNYLFPAHSFKNQFSPYTVIGNASLLFFLLFFAAFNAISQTQVYYDYSTGTNVNFTIPCGVDSITVQCWGGGGGGGGGTRGGGGGGGAFAFKGMAVTAGTVYNYTVGAGGTIAANSAGGAGGITYFRQGATNIVVAAGGNGGSAGAAGAGGTGGTVAASTGTYRYNGGTGAAGASDGGGGGGSANNLGAGNNGSGTTGGNGGNDTANPPTAGKGGTGATGTNHGGNANYYGGGGGGGRGSGTYGGYGTSGRVVIVTYAFGLQYQTPVSYCPGASVTLNPTIRGTVSSYSVTPSLPSGLSLNTTTGVISGTPTTSVAAANYTVTATYSCGSTTSAVVNIGINSPSSSGLSSGDWVFSGITSTIYETASNWLKWNGSAFTTSATVPQVTDNVWIKPSGTCISNQPTASNSANASYTAPSTSANCKNIVIESGATLTFANSNPHFHVNGNLTNNGTIVPGTGRLKFIGSGSQSLSSVNTSETFYQFHVISGSVTTINKTVTATNLLDLGGIVSTGSNMLYLSNAAADATAFPVSSGHIYGNFRRAIASNTNVHAFPMGVGTTATTHRRLLEFMNNGITGVSYLDCSVSNTFKGSGQNTDAYLDPTKAYHTPQVFTVVSSEGEWTLTPNTGPSAGNYGIRLYVKNFSGLSDNKFTILKRPNGSATFFDFDSYYTTTAIPAGNLPGRIYDSGNGYAQKTGFTAFSKFVIASAPSPLPVMLTHFSANCGDSCKIQWTTANEYNSSTFTVEKSRDYLLWTAIETIPATGNSNYITNYFSTDAHPFPGTSYYRLIETDLNGQTTIQGSLSVNCSGEENNTMIVFPNPAQGSFTVEISGDEDLAGRSVDIIDVTGRIIASRKIQVGKGKTQILFNDMDLSMGTYMVRIDSDKILPVKVVLY